MGILRSFVGIFVLLSIAYLFSLNRKSIRSRVVFSALLTQIGIGALILFFPLGEKALSLVASGVNRVLEFGNKGTEFMFGGLVSSQMFEVFGGGGFIFALRVLPVIIFVTALLSVLYYLGIMRFIVTGLGFIFQKLIGVSKIESFCAVTTIFLGQSEMPAVVKPFVKKLTGPEIFAIMSSGMAAVAGSVLAGYAGLGVKIEYLLAASVMAIPGGLMFAKIICPTTEENSIEFTDLSFEEKKPANIIEAAAVGASVGLQIVLNVGAMLIAFISLIALVNGFIGMFFGIFGYGELNLETILGYIFSPIAWLIGVPWEHAPLAGNFIGQKIVLNEFVAYANFSPYLKETSEVIAAGLVPLDGRTIAIISFALCGFANLASIAVLTGGFNAVAPERRSEVARYGLRVVLAGTLSNLMRPPLLAYF